MSYIESNSARPLNTINERRLPLFMFGFENKLIIFSFQYYLKIQSLNLGNLLLMNSVIDLEKNIWEESILRGQETITAIGIYQGSLIIVYRDKFIRLKRGNLF